MGNNLTMALCLGDPATYSALSALCKVDGALRRVGGENDVVLGQRVGNIPILSIMTLCLFYHDF